MGCVALLAAACTPAAAPAPTASKPAATTAPAPAAAAAAPGRASSAEWAQIVEAAKREGVVRCGCPPRPDYAEGFKKGFEAAYPGVKLETERASLPEFWVSVEKEQSTGQYQWDVYAFGATVEMFQLKNKGGVEPLAAYMVGPNIGTDADWEGGLTGPFIDKERKHVFGYQRHVFSTIGVNADLLPDARVDSFEKLLDPAYKGKIVWQDPRIGGAGVNFLTVMYMKYGREGLKKILVDQEPLLVKGQTELAEQFVRGGKPIAIPSMSKDTRVPFEQAGVKINEKLFNLEDIPGMAHGGSLVLVLKNPPHPNATKLYVDWVLSEAGQRVQAGIGGNGSWRKGVTSPGQTPDQIVRPGVEYFDAHFEENMLVKTVEAQKIARELLP